MTDSKSLSQERFNQFAAGYVTNKTHAKGAELERLLDIAQPQSDWVMLDIATGGGHTALKFAPHVKHVTATDLTPNMLDNAREFITGQGLTNVDFKLADAENLPFEDAMFDLVTCRIAAHHFPDAARFVRESVRVLKAGGLLLVQDQVSSEDDTTARYTDIFEALRDPSHNYVFSESQWRQLFTDAGLTVEHTEHIAKRHDLVHWAKMQGNTEPNIERLQVLLMIAPPAAAAWMDAQHAGTPEATFLNRHILIAGRKS